MRLRACLGGALLALTGACETVPETVLIELDDRTIELKKKAAAAAEAQAEAEAGPEGEVEPEAEADAGEPR